MFKQLLTCEYIETKNACSLVSCKTLEGFLMEKIPQKDSEDVTVPLGVTPFSKLL